jgi:hypothetical protein
MWHVRKRGEVYSSVWWENLRERDHLEDLGVDGRQRVSDETVEVRTLIRITLY